MGHSNHTEASILTADFQKGIEAMRSIFAVVLLVCMLVKLGHSCCDCNGGCCPSGWPVCCRDQNGESGCCASAYPICCPGGQWCAPSLAWCSSSRSSSQHGRLPNSILPRNETARANFPINDE